MDEALMDVSEEGSFFDSILDGLQGSHWRDLSDSPSSSEISSPPSSSSSHGSPPQPALPDFPFLSSPTITMPPSLYETCFENARQDSSPQPNHGLEDEKLLKRQRRLIKNRESAQLSRLRKKIYIEELERKVSHLVAQNELLTQQVQAISGDKKKLTDEVLYLQSLIKQTPHFGNAAATDTTIARRTTAPSANLKAAGVCLLMVLFSFGLLFNATSHNTPPQHRSLPWTHNRREQFPGFFSNSLVKPLPEVTPTPNNEQKQEEQKKGEQTFVAEKASSKTRGKRAREERHEGFVAIKEEADRTLAPPRKKTRTVMLTEAPPLEEVPLKETHGARTLTSLESKTHAVIPSHSAPPIPQRAIAASAVAASGVASSAVPEMVALLIPSNMLLSSPLLTAARSEVSSSPQLIQQFLNLYIWPMMPNRS